MSISLLTPWDFPKYLNPGMRAETVEMLLASVIGTIGYAVAAFFLAVATFSGFDRAAERPMREESAPLRLPPVEKQTKPKMPQDLS
jgi:hypothetical protein